MADFGETRRMAWSSALRSVFIAPSHGDRALDPEIEAAAVAFEAQLELFLASNYRNRYVAGACWQTYFRKARRVMPGTRAAKLGVSLDLAQIAIDEDFRGRGLLREIIRRFVAQAKVFNYDLVCVECIHSRKLASFLASLGWSPTKTEGAPDYVLRLREDEIGTSKGDDADDLNRAGERKSKPNPMGRPMAVGPERRALIIASYASGNKVPDIAAQQKLARGTVYRILQESGFRLGTSRTKTEDADEKEEDDGRF